MSEAREETTEQTLDIRKVIGYGLLALMVIFLIFAAGFVVNSWLTTRNTEFNALQNQVVQQEQELNKMKEVIANAQLMQSRNTVYRDILNRWKLPIPHDQDLDSFVIGVYFCETWCEWYKDKLPIVKRAYEESNCPSCYRQTKTKTKVVVVQQSCKDCEPPPKQQQRQEEKPVPEDIIGPTATCPTTQP